MPFDPNPHGPLNLRSLYHWAYKNFVESGDVTDSDIKDAIDDHKADPSGHPPFAGAGTTGFVPDPVVEEHKALSDTGEWRQATKVFFQPNQPTPAESATGDLWVVTQ